MCLYKKKYCRARCLCVPHSLSITIKTTTTTTTKILVEKKNQNEIKIFRRENSNQGEMMDRIEYCVTQTTDHVDSAKGELVKAEEYQSRARKVKLHYF